jgi:asparagine synthase (glutamine-hydrolysing)
MIGCLRHRGPDGEALWDGDGMTLAISRLAIVARDTPPRVYASEDGTVRSVVNGEIYNHHALREELIRAGHDVPAGPDTAVVPHLYESHGARFPERLEGMFAAAVWDSARRRLVVARDRMGEKPLFLAHGPHAVAFASEPKALVRLPWVSRDPAPASLLRYLAQGYFAGSDSAFAHIEQVRAAHVLDLELDSSQVSRRRYWRPWDALAAKNGAPPPASRPGDTLAAVEQAVLSRIPEETPFGVLLSGGVDSGLVVALASRRARGFPTFHLRMRESGYDESDFARRIAAKFGTDHQEQVLDAETAGEKLSELAHHMDQPLGDPSLLPTWMLTRFASLRVRAVLTGEGADELFAGYPTYLGHRVAPFVRLLPGTARRSLLGWLRSRPTAHPLSLVRLLERFVESATLPPYERHHAWFGISSPAAAHALLAPALREGVDRQQALAHLAEFAEELEQAGLVELALGGALVGYQLIDLEHYLGSGLLTKVDRCAMAHGLESRAPFLSRDLVEFALRLPDRSKLRGTRGKWILKQAADGLLPGGVLTRRKRGFSPPFSAWVRGPLRATIEDRLSPGRLERAGVLDAQAVGAVLAQHVSGHGEHGRLLWTLLSLQMWAEAWQSPVPEHALTESVQSSETESVASAP